MRFILLALPPRSPFLNIALGASPGSPAWPERKAGASAPPPSSPAQERCLSEAPGCAAACGWLALLVTSGMASFTVLSPSRQLLHLQPHASVSEVSEFCPRQWDWGLRCRCDVGPGQRQGGCGPACQAHPWLPAEDCPEVAGTKGLLERIVFLFLLFFLFSFFFFNFCLHLSWLNADFFILVTFKQL